MYIYIDESGIFRNPMERDNLVSSVAALAIPESVHDEIIEKFVELTSRWDTGSTKELKGSSLDEDQVSQIVTLLDRFDVILVPCLVDLGLHTEEDVTAHKYGQADGVTRKLTSDHHPNLVSEAKELADRILSLPDQLYLQAVTLTEAVSRMIQASTLRYSQSNPAELAAFRWRLDAKDEGQTEYEEVWSMTVMPLLQSKSIREPWIFLREGDYSSFRRFDVTPEMTEHLIPLVGPDASPEEFSDVRRIMEEDSKFVNSWDEPGIRLADILANAIQRACNGRLRRRGWKNIGRLMVKDVRTQRSVMNITVSQRVPTQPLPYADFFREANRKAKDPLLEDNTTSSRS